jgi:hypothetical protein
MSALHPKADMCGATRDVCFGPKADATMQMKKTASRWSLSKLTWCLIGQQPSAPCAARTYSSALSQPLDGHPRCGSDRMVDFVLFDF